MGENIVAIVGTMVTTIIASSGFWTYILKKQTSRSSESKMLMGLGHSRIIELSLIYIQNGSITQDEYNNLYTYLYLPYKELGGNGTAERIMDEVSKLPIRTRE